MAPKVLQVGRFLPPTPIRILLDKAGNNLGENVAFDGFNQQLSAVGRQTASKLAQKTWHKKSLKLFVLRHWLKCKHH